MKAADILASFVKDLRDAAMQIEQVAAYDANDAYEVQSNLRGVEDMVSLAKIQYRNRWEANRLTRDEQSVEEAM